MRLDERAWRVTVARDAQRVAGLLASAERRGDDETAARLSAELSALSKALTRAETPSRELVAREVMATPQRAQTTWPRLFTDSDSSLWDGLRPLLRDATEVDIVVAYLTVKGVELVGHGGLREALTRGCSLRLLTGCYLGGTRPDALVALRELTAKFSSANVRFVADPARHFHPKVYRVVSRDGVARLFVGSSNLSRDALTGRSGALEWNLGLDESSGADLLDEARARIDALFREEGVPLSDDLIARWKELAPSSQAPPPASLFDVEFERPAIAPNEAQREALACLDEVRRHGGTRALVVAPTGVGKTILAALDATTVVPPGEGRVLFVAHRRELLDQARRSFERVRGLDGSHGFVDQDEKSTQADHVYASVWSLDAIDDATLAGFDYVVIDEAHHGTSKSYRRLFDKCSPKFILGLTATPERLDGASIYPLFDGMVAYERTLLDAIEKKWLVPFKYFGVPDPIDYRKLAWTGGPLGYQIAQLERAVLDKARTRQVIAALENPRHAGARTLVFCVTIAHANHTAEALRDAGIRSACVHSGPGSTPRDKALRDLAEGRLDALVAVDVFNEGVDIPTLDRVVLLRPTDSATVFLQQLGRGLRLSPGKAWLTVVDLVGNHRRAAVRLGLLGVDEKELSRSKPGELFTRRWDDGREVTLDPQAIDAVRAVSRALTTTRAKVVAAIRDLRDGDARPTLGEVIAATGLSAERIVREEGGWFGLLGEAAAMTLDDAQVATSQAARDLLRTIEITRMTGPHKMLLLGAMAERGVASVDVRSGAALFRAHLTARHPEVRAHFIDKNGEDSLEARLASDVPREFPMQVLARSHPEFFALDGDTFKIRLPDDAPAALVFDAIAERAEAKLYRFARKGTE